MTEKTRRVWSCVLLAALSGAFGCTVNVEPSPQAGGVLAALSPCPARSASRCAILAPQSTVP